MILLTLSKIIRKGTHVHTYEKRLQRIRASVQDMEGKLNRASQHQRLAYQHQFTDQVADTIRGVQAELNALLDDLRNDAWMNEENQ